jgi:hypothetical protein
VVVAADVVVDAGEVGVVAPLPVVVVIGDVVSVVTELDVADVEGPDVVVSAVLAPQAARAAVSRAPIARVLALPRVIDPPEASGRDPDHTPPSTLSGALLPLWAVPRDRQ